MQEATATAPAADQQYIPIAPVPPLPGEIWPEQGGIYAGIMRGDKGVHYHLIIASGPNSDLSELTWGPYKTVPGCDSKWDGAANTAALRASDEEHPILLQTLAAPDDGVHDDWYLPAQRELALCWAVIPDMFEPDWYWSSTQCSSDGAWCQYFEHGSQHFISKVSKGRCRAVRRLIIQ